MKVDRTDMVKVKEYRLQQQGLRGRAISMPKTWVEDMGLTFGDTIEFYRTVDNDLVIRARSSNSKETVK
ncbi:MAG: AbrB/MazE/SpoVT family DNA-binding domain-containing protein [Petrotogales bacterium]